MTLGCEEIVDDKIPKKVLRSGRVKSVEEVSPNKVKIVITANGHELVLPADFDDDLECQVMTSYTGIMIMLMTGRMVTAYDWGRS